MKPYYKSGGVTIYHGDCREILPTLDQVDAVVTDPPYGLTANKKGGTGKASLNLNSPAGRSRISTGGGFMGQLWDSSVPDVEYWEIIKDAMKPGAHLLAFGGTRTFHRLTCAIEDAGFEIRDCLMYVYGTGFPKSLNVSKAIDKAAGAERKIIGLSTIGGGGASTGGNYKFGSADRAVGTDGLPVTSSATDAAKQWEGWGTALKPAWEPIILARKPLSEKTVAANVLKHGTGALNIDGCRIESTDDQLAEKYASVRNAPPRENAVYGKDKRARSEGPLEPHPQGRWPANLLHDGSDEVITRFPDAGGGDKRGECHGKSASGFFNVGAEGRGSEPHGQVYDDKGSAARFFYCAKVSSCERGKSDHPTMKPVALMSYLCRLITPPGGIILDAFMGSGSTLAAAQAEHFRAIGIELEERYVEIATKRLSQQVFDFDGGEA